MCTVPNFVGVETNHVRSEWTNAGFTGVVSFSPDWPPHYTVTSQSLAPGSVVRCTTDIAVQG
jgi:hypothetical protein